MRLCAVLASVGVTGPALCRYCVDTVLIYMFSVGQSDNTLYCHMHRTAPLPECELNCNYLIICHNVHN